MKLTRHNGRAGKNGVYNPKHNDRSFDIANSEHIDEERAKQNLYWDCYNGFRNFKNPEKENELSATFEDVEQLFYRQRYHDFVTGQNERNVKNRHPERNKETGDLLKSKKTCPEETVYQIGTLDNHVPPELLIEIVTEFMEIVNERFGSHVHILNWALHLMKVPLIFTSVMCSTVKINMERLPHNRKRLWKHWGLNCRNRRSQSEEKTTAR